MSNPRQDGASGIRVGSTEGSIENAATLGPQEQTPAPASSTPSVVRRLRENDPEFKDLQTLSRTVPFENVSQRIIIETMGHMSHVSGLTTPTDTGGSVPQVTQLPSRGDVTLNRSRLPNPPSAVSVAQSNRDNKSNPIEPIETRHSTIRSTQGSIPRTNSKRSDIGYSEEEINPDNTEETVLAISPEEAPSQESAFPPLTRITTHTPTDSCFRFFGAHEDKRVNVTHENLYTMILKTESEVEHFLNVALSILSYSFILTLGTPAVVGILSAVRAYLSKEQNLSEAAATTPNHSIDFASYIIMVVGFLLTTAFIAAGANAIRTSRHAQDNREILRSFQKPTTSQPKTESKADNNNNDEEPPLRRRTKK